MFFIVDDSLFPGNIDTCTLHIVYYDTGSNNTSQVSWRIIYDAIGNGVKVLTGVENTDSGAWKELYINITDGRFKHKGPHGSDIILVNVDSNPEMFALVEILKPSQ